MKKKQEKTIKHIQNWWHCKEDKKKYDERKYIAIKCARCWTLKANTIHKKEYEHKEQANFQ